MEHGACFQKNLRKILFFTCLFLAVLGLCCCPGFSLVVAHGLLLHGFCCCGAWALGYAGFSSGGPQALEHRYGSCVVPAQLLRGMWDLPGPGIESVPPTLAGGFFTTEPLGKL